MKVGLLIVVTAFALGMAGTASASGTAPDDRALSRATSPGLNRSIGPDDRAVSRATSPGLNRSIGPDDRAVSRATSLDPNWTPQPTLVRVSTRSFHWTDAGIGASGAFGIALVLVGGGLLIQRRRVVAA
jgi:hypothetical protein